MFLSTLALTLVVGCIHADIIAVSSSAPAFSGAQSGIGSWFYTDADGTNGNSWCGYPYNDGMPIFAPSLALMGGATSGSAWTSQTQQYCGREIKVTWKGTSKLLYLGDAFAQPRSDGAIDIAPDAWTSLYGSSPNSDHDLVMNPVQWEFTGNVNTAYTAKGASFGSAAGGASAASSVASSTQVDTGGGPTGAPTGGSAPSTPTSMTTKVKPSKPKSSPSNPPAGGSGSGSSGGGGGNGDQKKGYGDCDWQWHCQGAPCKTYNDCGDPFSCINNVCT